jgi:hypothetical protein
LVEMTPRPHVDLMEETVMSNGSVLGVGSVVSMVPADGWCAVYVGDGSLAEDVRPELMVPVIGWAVVVTARSGWEMDTRVRPVLIMDSLVRVGLPDDWDLVST